MMSSGLEQMENSIIWTRNKPILVIIGRIVEVPFHSADISIHSRIKVLTHNDGKSTWRECDVGLQIVDHGKGCSPDVVDEISLGKFPNFCYDCILLDCIESRWFCNSTSNGRPIPAVIVLPDNQTDDEATSAESGSRHHIHWLLKA